ncbi:hypothetical protein [Helicobacter sp. 11S02596-1]|uniref:hypothetical protein n=1 Tax=Helicobacter sp. 11S02596-1 TaxID=1476194 RepID=UPI000BA700D7|nr:hypothetical protein [Helicobacter sp. 11S02596-1]PAF42111.1 hypothetical protein BJI48_07310 [Helicobacter sp. 11S02596-1]
MFSKKLMMILLLLGALVILVLLGVSYQLSSKIKTELQTTLNDYVATMVRDYASSDKPFSVKFEPFVCRGISSYQCVSKHIGLIDTATHQEVFGVSDLALNIDDIGTSSIRISAKSPKLIFEGLDALATQSGNKELMGIYEVFKPNAFSCNQNNEVIDKYAGEIVSHNQCAFVAKDMQYDYGFDIKIKSAKFADKTILNAIISYYSKLGFPEKLSQEIDDFDFGVDKVYFSLASNTLKNVLYPIFESDYKSRNQDLKIPFDDKIYEQALGDTKGLIGFGLAMTGLLGGPYQEALVGFVDGMGMMAMGEASKVSVSLLPKQTPAPYFKIPPEMILNLDKPGSQQRMLAKIFNHYDLIVDTTLNTNK